MSTLFGALLYYVSYHGSVGVIFDMSFLAFADETARKVFVQSATFDDIAAFTSFFIPTFLTASFLGFALKTKPVYISVALCCIYSFILWATLWHFFGNGSVRLSDIAAPILAIPLSWVTFYVVSRHA